jgi:hypothetical protein
MQEWHLSLVGNHGGKEETMSDETKYQEITDRDVFMSSDSLASLSYTRSLVMMSSVFQLTAPERTTSCLISLDT